jgi:hypothetical protein
VGLLTRTKPELPANGSIIGVDHESGVVNLA